MKQDYNCGGRQKPDLSAWCGGEWDGFDVCFISEAESMRAASLQKREQAACRQNPLPHEGRMGNVHFMTVKGEFEGLEYAFEEDGKEAADPFGRQFAGCGRWA